MKFHIFQIILLFILFTSCEKDVNLKLDKIPNQLVVDASIENGMPPIVILSKSLNYFSKINRDTLAASFVKNASVFISTDTKNVKLTADSLINNDGFVVHFYTSKPGPDFFVGELKNTYNLKIIYNGNQFTATTTIPELTRKIDSLWVEQLNEKKDSNNIKIAVSQTDKKGLGDFMRYFTSVNNSFYLPGLNSVYADELNDGISFTTFLDRGVDKNLDNKLFNFNYSKGDTVTYKFCNIDIKCFDFWRTFEYNYQSNGNPFASPIKILSNIQGGGFGYFGGYAAQYKTLIIPK
jgi:hypothetical protein